MPKGNQRRRLCALCLASSEKPQRPRVNFCVDIQTRCCRYVSLYRSSAPLNITRIGGAFYNHELSFALLSWHPPLARCCHHHRQGARRHSRVR